MIEEISLTNFRCFSEIQINFSAGINLLTGINGSGKTSIIEALYLLGRGRSFRTNFLSDMICRGKDSSIVFMRGQSLELPLRIGCEINRSSLAIRVNNQQVKKRSLLLDALPLQIITPTSHELIDSGPSFRRKFIDWGLFHVEQSYRQNWSFFRRVLKQRNQLLKTNARETTTNWDLEFVRYAEILNSYRDSYFSELEPFFIQIQEKLLGSKFADIEYYPGWNIKMGLSSELDRLRKRDQLSGWTNCGPHKADLKFLFGHSQRNVLSRGQQKMLVFSLQIAQCLHLWKSLDQAPLLLIDDISSELDTVNLNRLFDVIRELGFQCIVSSIDSDKINPEYVSSVFHVEHVEGEIN